MLAAQTESLPALLTPRDALGRHVHNLMRQHAAAPRRVAPRCLLPVIAERISGQIMLKLHVPVPHVLKLIRTLVVRRNAQLAKVGVPRASVKVVLTAPIQIQLMEKLVKLGEYARQVINLLEALKHQMSPAHLAQTDSSQLYR